MPRKTGKRVVIGGHFKWVIGGRNGVCYADGRRHAGPNRPADSRELAQSWRSWLRQSKGGCKSVKLNGLQPPFV